MTRLALLIGIVSMACACTTVVFEGTADRLRLLPSEVQDTRYVGETVVWGGRLISLRRVEEGYDLEVMAYPLDLANRPRLDARPGGRFVAHFPGELATTVFSEGGEVTLAGTLGEPRTAEIDGYQLMLPSVLTRRIHPWQ